MIPDPDSILYTFEDGQTILAKELTCYSCVFRGKCKHTDDLLNVHGECLSLK